MKMKGLLKHQQIIAVLKSALKEDIKERETFLKGINGQLTTVNEITGEVATLYPPKKTGSETISITLK